MFGRRVDAEKVTGAMAQGAVANSLGMARTGTRGRAIAAIGLALVLCATGCTFRRDQPTIDDTPEPGLRFVGDFGRGRDGCRVVGDSQFAREMQRPGRALIACPAGSPAGTTLLQTGAEQVGRTRNYSIFAVAVAPAPVPEAPSGTATPAGPISPAGAPG
ncbi:MAG: hypothetical protein AAFU80_11845 [Pseudomonadota bacterium]